MGFGKIFSIIFPAKGGFGATSNKNHYTLDEPKIAKLFNVVDLINRCLSTLPQNHVFDLRSHLKVIYSASFR